MIRDRSRIYYGWAMLALAAAAMVGTLPGRTQGLGLVTEPLLTDLRIGRVDYAQLNLSATLIGSGFAIGIGRVLDRLGQSALSVISIAIVGHWFVRKIDLAVAIYSIALSISFMIAFPVVGSLRQVFGWRAAWLAIAMALIVGLAPLSWWLARSSPEATATLLASPGNRRSPLPPFGSSPSAPRSTVWSHQASACSTNRSSPSEGLTPTSTTRHWS